MKKAQCDRMFFKNASEVIKRQKELPDPQDPSKSNHRGYKCNQCDGWHLVPEDPEYIRENKTGLNITKM